MVNCVAVCGLRRWMCSAACEKNNPQQYLLFCKNLFWELLWGTSINIRFFLSNPGPIIGLPCHSVTQSINLHLLSKMLHLTVKVFTWICQQCYIYLTNSLHIFVFAKVLICICQSLHMYFLPSVKANQAVWFGLFFLCACKYKHDCVMMKLKLSKSTQSSFNWVLNS